MNHQPDEHHDITRPIAIRATCPSCGTISLFDLIGLQRWPRKVAAYRGVSEIHPMWQCHNCHTTLLEASIHPLLDAD